MNADNGVDDRVRRGSQTDDWKRRRRGEAEAAESQPGPGRSASVAALPVLVLASASFGLFWFDPPLHGTMAGDAQPGVDGMLIVLAALVPYISQAAVEVTTGTVVPS